MKHIDGWKLNTAAVYLIIALFPICRASSAHLVWILDLIRASFSFHRRYLIHSVCLKSGLFQLKTIQPLINTIDNNVSKPVLCTKFIYTRHSTSLLCTKIHTFQCNWKFSSKQMRLIYTHVLAFVFSSMVFCIIIKR